MDFFFVWIYYDGKCIYIDICCEGINRWGYCKLVDCRGNIRCNSFIFVIYCWIDEVVSNEVGNGIW